MNKKTMLFTAISILTMAACSQANEPAVAPQATASANTVATVHTVKKAEGIWIDVRTPEEFQSGHIDGAVNIPVEQIAEKIAQAAPDKNAPINVYCRSGRRSEIALQELQKMGYTQVSNQGGYQDLIQKGVR